MMKRITPLGVSVGLLLMALGCTHWGSSRLERTRPVAQQKSTQAQPPKKNNPKQVEKNTPAPTPVPTRQLSEVDKKQAHALYERASDLYAHGKYDEAEALLKEALQVYPFMPQ